MVAWTREMHGVPGAGDWWPLSLCPLSEQHRHLSIPHETSLHWGKQWDTETWSRTKLATDASKRGLEFFCFGEIDGMFREDEVINFLSMFPFPHVSCVSMALWPPSLGTLHINNCNQGSQIRWMFNLEGRSKKIVYCKNCHEGLSLIITVITRHTLTEGLRITGG